MHTARSGPDSIATVTGSTFAATVLAEQGPIVVEFMSYGCSHCRALEPALVEVANMEDRGETFVRVNVAVEPDLAEKYEIGGTPTLIMFLNGAVVGRVEGPHPSVASILKAVTEAFAR
jgi:thioredoxin 1